MEKYFVNHTTLDKLDLPAVVYKYRDAENPYHRSVVEEGRLYFSPPEGFEDEMDCKIPTRYDLLTDDEIFNKYYSDLKAEYPHYNDEYLKQEAKKWQRAGRMRDPIHLARARAMQWDILNKQFGVLSLTEDFANPKMWGKYSNFLNGFCAGFDAKIMFVGFGGGGAVTYYDVLPDILPFDPEHVKHLKLTFSKLKEWDFEKEYRVHKFWPHEVTRDEWNMRVADNSLVEIIIGENVSDASKKLNPNVRIFKASLTDDDNIKVEAFI